MTMSAQIMNMIIFIIGTLFIFLGAIMAIIYVLVNKKNATFKYLEYVQYAAMCLYFAGGGVYWIGGCVFAAAWNSTFGDVDKITAFSGIWWAEITFVSVHAVIAGTLYVNIAILCMFYVFVLYTIKGSI